jgi:hypothetical protein
MYKYGRLKRTTHAVVPALDILIGYQEIERVALVLHTSLVRA